MLRTFICLLLLWLSVSPLLQDGLVKGTDVASQDEVTFRSEDGFRLEGTLRLPASPDPVPGVVLIHGSGTLSRDVVLPTNWFTTSFTTPIYRQMANVLQSNGVAVLTYDKRSCSRFNNCYDNRYPVQTGLTADNFYDDALAAVLYLQERPEVDSDRIVVVGHSESGYFIPIMLATKPDIWRGVMISGAFHPIDDILEYQRNFTIDLFVTLGVDEETAIASQAALTKLIEEVRAIKAGGVEDAGGIGAAYYQSLFRISEEAVVAAADISQPLLILNGDEDWQVPPSEAQAWADYLTEIGTDFEMRVLPCVTHGLACLSEPDYSKITIDSFGREVDPQVTNALLEFITNTTTDGGEDSSAVSHVSKTWGLWAALGVTAVALLFYD